jgi:CMP-2-keto-3-deoxyoctulosonic acid synthetase
MPDKKLEGGFNKVQINYVKDSVGKSSIMINIREDDPLKALELYKKMRLNLIKTNNEIKSELEDEKSNKEMAEPPF